MSTSPRAAAKLAAVVARWSDGGEHTCHIEGQRSAVADEILR